MIYDRVVHTTHNRRKLTTAHRGAVVVAAGTALAATFLAVTACESAGHGGTTKASTATSSVASPSSTTAAPTNAPQGQDNQLAVQTLDAIVRGDFAAATTRFDSQLRQKLSADALASDWAMYQQTLGKYQSHGDPEQVQRGDITVVNVPLQMERSPGQFRVTFHPDGTIAGLAFLRPGVPVP